MGDFGHSGDTIMRRSQLTTCTLAVRQMGWYLLWPVQYAVGIFIEQLLCLSIPKAASGRALAQGQGGAVPNFSAEPLPLLGGFKILAFLRPPLETHDQMV